MNTQTPKSISAATQSAREPRFWFNSKTAVTFFNLLLQHEEEKDMKNRKENSSPHHVPKPCTTQSAALKSKGKGNRKGLLQRANRK
jgi:hypothetical protein